MKSKYSLLLLIVSVVVFLNHFEIAAQHLTIDKVAFKKAMKEPGVLIIDVRTQAEYEEGNINNCMNVDYRNQKEFVRYIDSLDRSHAVLLYCRSGRRSKDALELMKKMGFKSVRELAGGYKRWASDSE